MSLKRQKQNLERKLVVHFPRRTLINEKRKSNHKETTITTQPTLSMKVKTKSKPMSLLNANEKCSFEPPSKRENTKHLTLYQSLVLSQSDRLNSRSQRERKCQTEPRNESQATKGKKDLETLNLFQQAN
jgi:hypothetical protein